MVSHLVTKYTVLIAVFGALALFSACDNTIEPFAEETGVYSIYGTLEVDRSPNYIRVKDLNEPNIRDSTIDIDATVTMENLDDGSIERLGYVIDEFDDVFVHNFKSELDIAPATRYALTVERSDGVTARATTKTPDITPAYLVPEGGNCLTTHSAVFEEVSNPRLVQTWVGFQYQGERRWARRSVDRTPEHQVGLRFTPEEVLAGYIESQDDPEVEVVYTPRCGELDHDTLYVRYRHLGLDWLDQELPPHPLESRDVENGLGFLGGFYNDTMSVRIDTTEIPQMPM